MRRGVEVEAIVQRESGYHPAMLLALLFQVALLQPAQLLPTALAAPPTVFPVRFLVAEGEAGPVADTAWLDAQLADANRIFADWGVQFARAEVVPLPAPHGVLEDRPARNALGALVVGQVINAFIVASLRDVDDPKLFRQGVHWRPAGRTADKRGRIKHLVIVAAYARPTVLAHELGHFFGNPSHTHVPGNIMSYNRGDTPPTLDARQGRHVQAFARQAVRSGELVPVVAAAPDTAEAPSAPVAPAPPPVIAPK